MARRRHRPQWHLLLTLAGLVGAAAAALYLGRPEPPPPDPEPVEAPSPPPPPEPASVAAGLRADTDSVLAELGIPPGRVNMQASAAGPDVISVRVPGDLPLASVNLRLTRLAGRHGGEVVRGAELKDGTAVDLSFGIDAVVTTRFHLRQDARSTRRAGRIALVADAGSPHLERLCALPPSLTLVALGRNRREAAEPCGAAGHRVVTRPIGLRAPPDSVGAATRAAADRQLWALAERAAAKGEVVALVTPNGPTLEALEALMPRLESRGHTFVSVSGIGR